MTTVGKLRDEVARILGTQWKKRDGQKVPEAEDVQLGNDAVCLEGTVLYADLANSTGLVNGFKDRFAAEVYKTYLSSACQLIRDHGGVVTAFDGDRVMAVYIGEDRNASAVKSAMKIKYAVQEVINPALKAAYPNSSYQLEQAVGIDTSDLFVARTGIRGANDLVWVGRSANYAAKLCGLRNGGYCSFITQSVHSGLSEETRYGGTPRTDMWEKVTWTAMGISIYRSSWQWSF